MQSVIPVIDGGELVVETVPFEVLKDNSEIEDPLASEAEVAAAYTPSLTQRTRTERRVSVNFITLNIFKLFALNAPHKARRWFIIMEREVTWIP
jgi:hypothetical protein